MSKKVKVKRSSEVVVGKAGEVTTAGQGEGNVTKASKTKVARGKSPTRKPR